MNAAILGFSLAQTAIAASPSPCTTEVVAPARGPRVDAFLAWFQGREEADLMKYAGELASDVRIVDVDNDGGDEFVVSHVGGSGAYLTVSVFRPAGDAFVPVAVPEGLAFDHEYGDQETGESRLVERVCGRTYLNLVGGEATGIGKVGYLWQRGSVRRACDADWLREQRRQFQALFDRKLYRAARPLLEGTEACAAAAEPELWLWLQSDVALAAHRMRTHDECIAHVEAAQRSAAHGRGSAAVRAALARNGALCRQARRRLRTPAGQDFSWMLELEKDPARQFVLDERFEDVLTAIVPDAAVEGRSLRDELRLDLYLPGETRFEDGRYVVLTGCRPHDCGSKGFVWVDVKDKRGVVYIGGHMASRSFGPRAVPAAVWKHLRDTIGVSEDSEIEFTDAAGRRTRIAVPD